MNVQYIKSNNTSPYERLVLDYMKSIQYHYDDKDNITWDNNDNNNNNNNNNNIIEIFLLTTVAILLVISLSTVLTHPQCSVLSLHISHLLFIFWFIILYKFNVKMIEI